MSFNYYLRNKLLETNTSKSQLATDINVTKAMITRWIKPYSKNPSEKSMRKVIEYFGDDCSEILQIFRAEEYWATFFWKNYRAAFLEKHLFWADVPGIDEDVLRRYNAGACEYVELEDLKKIAAYCNCSIDRLVNNNTIVEGGYNNVDLIGPTVSTNDHWGLNIYFYSDYIVGSTEMEPIIHFGDHISLKRDYISDRLVLKPNKGDIVVIENLLDNKLYIRRVDVLNDTIVYTPNNTEFKPIPDSEDIRVRGIVSQSITRF